MEYYQLFLLSNVGFTFLLFVIDQFFLGARIRKNFSLILELMRNEKKLKEVVSPHLEMKKKFLVKPFFTCVIFSLIIILIVVLFYDEFHDLLVSSVLIPTEVQIKDENGNTKIMNWKLYFNKNNDQYLGRRVRLKLEDGNIFTDQAADLTSRSPNYIKIMRQRYDLYHPSGFLQYLSGKCVFYESIQSEDDEDDEEGDEDYEVYEDDEENVLIVEAWLRRGNFNEVYLECSVGTSFGFRLILVIFSVIFIYFTLFTKVLWKMLTLQVKNELDWNMVRVYSKATLRGRSIARDEFHMIKLAVKSSEYLDKEMKRKKKVYEDEECCITRNWIISKKGGGGCYIGEDSQCILIKKNFDSKKETEKEEEEDDDDDDDDDDDEEERVVVKEEEEEMIFYIEDKNTKTSIDLAESYENDTQNKVIMKVCEVNECFEDWVKKKHGEILGEEKKEL